MSATILASFPEPPHEAAPEDEPNPGSAARFIPGLLLGLLCWAIIGTFVRLVA
jgi:hypothetical protein